jgi:hypothetical protein
LDSENGVSFNGPQLKKLPTHMLLCQALARGEELARGFGKFTKPIAKHG